MSRFKPGDHVYIGEPKRGKVHWEVAGLFDDYAALQSPMSGRRTFILIDNLTPYSPEGAKP